MKVSHLVGFAPVVAGGVLPRNTDCRALYFLDNNPAGASIIALKVSAMDGTLSDPVRTPTGGLGKFSMNGMAVSTGDQLFSQDAVVTVGKRLFTVNPGSNTVSLFTIPDNDPTRPVLTGAPVSTVGEYPNSVAFSHALHIACVLSTGAHGGVQCYHVDDSGLSPMGAFMALPIPQMTPPMGPPNTASDILFNPGSTALFVTLKGDGMGPGYVFAFPVKDGKVVATPVVSRPPELLLPFSMNFIDDTHALITDPAYGASFVKIAYPSLMVTVTKKVTIPGQGAICWGVYADRYDAVYIFDGGHPNITTLDPDTGEVKYVIPAPAETMGSFDSIASGGYLYVLQGVAGISVFDLAGSKGNGKVPMLIQNKNLSALGSRQGWQGLALY